MSIDLPNRNLGFSTTAKALLITWVMVGDNLPNRRQDVLWISGLINLDPTLKNFKLIWPEFIRILIVWWKWLPFILSYSNGVLNIKGEKTKETVEEECCYCSERYSGSFERSFRIPGKVKEEGIESSYKDGILKVTLPKHEESQVKKIEVKH